jgi:hypothetical protein
MLEVQPRMYVWFVQETFSRNRFRFHLLMILELKFRSIRMNIANLHNDGRFSWLQHPAVQFTSSISDREKLSIRTHDWIANEWPPSVATLPTSIHYWIPLTKIIQSLMRPGWWCRAIESPWIREQTFAADTAAERASLWMV